MPIMVASIANFDKPRQFSSVKPPKSRMHSGVQTDDGYSDMESVGEISVSIQADLDLSKMAAQHKIENSGKVLVDVGDSNKNNRNQGSEKVKISSYFT